LQKKRNNPPEPWTSPTGSFGEGKGVLGKKGGPAESERDVRHFLETREKNLYWRDGDRRGLIKKKSLFRNRGGGGGKKIKRGVVKTAGLLGKVLLGKKKTEEGTFRRDR